MSSGPPESPGEQPVRKRLRVLNAVDASTLPAHNAPALLQPTAVIERTPCRTCVADCCRLYDVYLSAYEAARLSCVLAIPLEGLVEPEPFEAFDDEVGAAVYHSIDLDAGPSRLRFRRRGDGACVFLWHTMGRGRCGAHGLRPGLCRLYPFDVRVGDESFRAGNDGLCVAQWTTDEAREAEIEASLTAWKVDLQADEELVAAWNAEEREDRSLVAFGAHLIERCAPDFGVPTEDIVGRQPRALRTRPPAE